MLVPTVNTHTVTDFHMLQLSRYNVHHWSYKILVPYMIKVRDPVTRVSLQLMLSALLFLGGLDSILVLTPLIGPLTSVSGFKALSGGV